MCTIGSTKESKTFRYIRSISDHRHAKTVKMRQKNHLQTTENNHRFLTRFYLRSQFLLQNNCSFFVYPDKVTLLDPKMLPAPQSCKCSPDCFSFLPLAASMLPTPTLASAHPSCISSLRLHGCPHPTPYYLTVPSGFMGVLTLVGVPPQLSLNVAMVTPTLLQCLTLECLSEPPCHSL